MGMGDQLGEVGICSECHQQRKIVLKWDKGKNRHGEFHSPYLRCEDCTKLDLDIDKKD